MVNVELRIVSALATRRILARRQIRRILARRQIRRIPVEAKAVEGIPVEAKAVEVSGDVAGVVVLPEG